MPDQNYPLTPQTLPSGFCPIGWQAILNSFAANLFVTIPGSSGLVIISATKPDSQYEGSAAWYRLDDSGRPTYLYWFAQGAWLSLHPTRPGLTMWWFDALPNFNTYDGGDANPPSIISGPMWQQAKNIDNVLITAKFPITAGTLPGGTVLAVGDTGGVDTHTITLAEVAPHTHEVDFITFSDGREAGIDRGFVKTETPDGSVQTGSAGGTGSPAAAQPFSIINPYVTGYLLQRTDREYFAVS